MNFGFRQVEKVEFYLNLWKYISVTTADPSHCCLQLELFTCSMIQIVKNHNMLTRRSLLVRVDNTEPVMYPSSAHTVDFNDSIMSD